MSSKFIKEQEPRRDFRARRCLLCGAEGDRMFGHVHKGKDIIDVVFCDIHRPNSMSRRSNIDYIVVPNDDCMDTPWNPCFGNYHNRIGMKFTGNPHFARPWQGKRKTL